MPALDPKSQIALVVRFKMGLASAMGWILLIIALVLIWILLGAERRFGYRQ